VSLAETSNSFGHNDWASYAPGLKTLDDATYLRRRILLAFERAETEIGAQEETVRRNSHADDRSS
jgi:NADH dehydrogenase FAD-containing subunit